MKRKEKITCFSEGEMASSRPWFHPHWNKLNENLAPSPEFVPSPAKSAQDVMLYFTVFNFSEQHAV